MKPSCQRCISGLLPCGGGALLDQQAALNKTAVLLTFLLAMGAHFISMAVTADKSSAVSADKAQEGP